MKEIRIRQCMVSYEEFVLSLLIRKAALKPVHRTYLTGTTLIIRPPVQVSDYYFWNPSWNFVRKYIFTNNKKIPSRKAKSIKIFSVRRLFNYSYVYRNQKYCFQHSEHLYESFRNNNSESCTRDSITFYMSYFKLIGFC